MCTYVHIIYAWRACGFSVICRHTSPQTSASVQSQTCSDSTGSIQLATKSLQSKDRRWQAERILRFPSKHLVTIVSVCFALCQSGIDLSAVPISTNTISVLQNASQVLLEFAAKRAHLILEQCAGPGDKAAWAPEPNHPITSKEKNTTASYYKECRHARLMRPPRWHNLVFGSKAEALHWASTVSSNIEPWRKIL